MSRKSMIAAVAASTLLFAAACSSGGDKDAASGDGAGGSGGSTAALDVWVMGDSSDDIKRIADAYSEETGQAVNLQSIPWGSVYDLLLTAVASGEGPDVLQMGTTLMPEMVDAGALLDLTEQVNSVPEFATDNFFPGIVQTTEYDGAYYGIPWYTETRVLFYRTDLLESVGYPDGPETWDDLYDAATKLADRGPEMYGVDLNPKEPIQGFFYARQNGSPLFDARVPRSSTSQSSSRPLSS